MLILATTSDRIELVTGQAITVDVHASFVDWDGTVATPGNKNTLISTATTTQIVAPPAVFRTIKTLIIRNRHASSSVDVTVLHVATAGAIVSELLKITLQAGKTLVWAEGVGFLLEVAGAFLPLAGGIMTGDLLFAPSVKARMDGQNRFRMLQSMVVALRTTAQSIPNATFTAVQFNAADEIDTDGLHDPVTNNTRLTAAVAGQYMCVAVGAFVSGAGSRIFELFKNAGSTNWRLRFDGASSETKELIGFVALAAGDFVEFMVWQNSGAALDFAGAASDLTNTRLGMTYVGE